VAAALGAKALATSGVLLTRLSAADEAGTMDVLCVDKTGTLTKNALTVAHVAPLHDLDAAQVLALAALASSDGGQDKVDAAIRSATSAQPAAGIPQLVSFLPFDPATKMSASMVTGPANAALRVVKGAYSAVSVLAAPDPRAAAEGTALENKGYRVLAVAVGPSGALRLAGLIALSDPPRGDSASLIAELTALRVCTVMVIRCCRSGPRKCSIGLSCFTASATSSVATSPWFW
jgi:H+-transporting ATPase